MRKWERIKDGTSISGESDISNLQLLNHTSVDIRSQEKKNTNSTIEITNDTILKEKVAIKVDEKFVTDNRTKRNKVKKSYADELKVQKSDIVMKKDTSNSTNNVTFKSGESDIYFNITDKSYCVGNFRNSSKIGNVSINRGSGVTELEVSLNPPGESSSFDLLNRKDQEILNVSEVLANEEEDNTDKSCCVDDFSNSSRIRNIPKNRSSVLNELEVSLDLLKNL